MRKFKDQCQNETVLVATDNSTVVAYIIKQGGTHLAEMCALLWRLMTWCHPYKITLRARHITGFLNVMIHLLSRSTKSNQQNGLCIRWCSNRSVKWFTPHVDLFATPLNHKVSIVCISCPCLSLPSHGSPSQGDPKSGNPIASSL